VKRSVVSEVAKQELRDQDKERIRRATAWLERLRRSAATSVSGSHGADQTLRVRKTFSRSSANRVRRRLSRPENITTMRGLPALNLADRLSGWNPAPM
jgi:hypothetical protein